MRNKSASQVQAGARWFRDTSAYMLLSGLAERRGMGIEELVCNLWLSHSEMTTQSHRRSHLPNTRPLIFLAYLCIAYRSWSTLPK